MIRVYDFQDLTLLLSRRKRLSLMKRRWATGYFGTPPTPAINAGTPTGMQMPDGYSSKIVFGLFPNLPMWEVSPKFGGLDGGAPIKMSTMRNALYHTAAPRTLLMVEDTEIEVSFNPDLWNKVKNHLLNKNGTVTAWFPDGSTLAFYGWLGKLGQMSMVEGEMPKCPITVHCGNRDPNDGSEQGPVMTPATGT